MENAVSEEIRKQIVGILREIEEKENVKVLYAAESGSRAWGVASPDSDYDVRFIYVRRASDYLRLDEVRDVIEWQLDEVLDINGWDLKKALRHFHRGNATLFEWCSSPFVYWTTPEWEKTCETGRRYFSTKAAMHHYYGTARATFERFLRGDSVKYKKYVYALRPILACRFIEERNVAPPELCEPVERMLELKRRSGEAEALPQIPAILGFIEEELCRLERVAMERPDDRKGDWEPLNMAFWEFL